MHSKVKREKGFQSVKPLILWGEFIKASSFLSWDIQERVGLESLEELLQCQHWFVSNSPCFSINITWPISFILLFIHVCLYRYIFSCLMIYCRSIKCFYVPCRISSSWWNLGPQAQRLKIGEDNCQKWVSHTSFFYLLCL